MKYWFNDFLDELSENLSKIWIKYKKGKNPEYKESKNLINNIRKAIGVFFIIIMIVVVIAVFKQMQHDLGM